MMRLSVIVIFSLIGLVDGLAGSGEAEGPERNLALPRNGAFVLASSFADYETHYPDRLIDGSEETSWRASGNQSPQWIEIRWRGPVRVDRLEIISSGTFQKDACSFWRWDHEWRKIEGIKSSTEAGKEGQTIRFPRITTERIKVIFEAGGGVPVEIRQIEAYGPAQTLATDLLPRWNAWYVWYPEPAKAYKGGSSYYFRKEFEIPDLDEIESAAVQVRSNDRYSIFVNGKPVYKTSSARAGKALPITRLLRPGKNVVAIETGLNSAPGWGLGLLIADLNLVGKSGARRIGTDASWKTSDQTFAGWESPEFDDAGWKQSFEFYKPPAGPWGDIRYHTALPKEIVVFKGLSIHPQRPRPGGEVEITFNLSVPKELRGDYIFQVEIGDAGVLSGKSDFRLASCLADAGPLEEQGKVTAKFSLPDYAPGGNVPIYLRAFDRKGGRELELHSEGLTEAGGKPHRVGFMEIDRADSPTTISSQADTKARPDHGGPGLVLGGNLYPPAFWSPSTPTFEKFGTYSKTGIDLFFIYSGTKIGPEDWKTTACAAVEEAVTNLLKVNPDAFVLLKVELRPTFDWLNAHPGERLIKANGQMGPQSFASKRYAELVETSLRELLAYIGSRPYADRVVGYMLWAPGRADAGLGGVDENIWQHDRTKITIGDYNPQAKEAFRTWLKKRYEGSDSALQAAWKDPEVTFEKAGVSSQDLISEGVDGGVFTDPARGRATYDYFEFLSQLLPEFYIRMGNVVKEVTKNRALVGIHYGYIIDQVQAVHPGTGAQNGNFYLSRLLDDPAIDFYCGSTVYGAARKAGSAFQVRLPWSSINLHGKLYVNDGDQRTFIAYPVTYGRQSSEQETLSVLKRDLGSTLIRNLGIWFADFSKEEGRSAVGWFMFPSILETIQKFGELYRHRLETPGNSTTEIAVFLDEKSYFTHDFYGSPLLYQNLVGETVYHELPRIGAPFDVFTLSDLKDRRVQDQYKLYIFLNAFQLSKLDRENIAAIKKDRKTLLWFYAPGYVNDGRPLAASSIAEITGIETRQSPFSPADYKITPGNSLSETLDGKSSRLKLMASAQEKKMLGVRGVELRPGFVIDDPQSSTIAVWPGGAAALAEKDFRTWRSVYSALPYMSSDVLREVARRAGVHIYCDEDLILDADSSLLMVHNGFGETKKVSIRLPLPKDVYESSSGRLVSPGAKLVDLEIPENETLLYLLK